MSSRHGLEIRTATPADAPSLVALAAAAGHAVAAHTLAARLDRLHRAPGTALLALEWGPPSGLIVLHWFVSLAADHPVADVTQLLVGPDQRRPRVARLVVSAACQAARAAGCHEIGILAPADQAGLLAFCQATGFAADGTRLRRPLRRGGREVDA